MSQATIEQYAEVVDSQYRRITKQEFRIKELEKKFCNLQESVYQLVGGLYNQEKQAGIIQYHISHLYPDEEADEAKDHPEGWGVMPTTRQGDKLEEISKTLEKRISALEKASPQILEQTSLERDKHMNDSIDRILILGFAFKELAAARKALERKEKMEIEDDNISTSSCSSVVTKKRRMSSYLCGNE